MAKPKRELSYHEKQIRFLTFFFGTILVLVTAGLLWILNHIGSP
jgi:hypothetical protein